MVSAARAATKPLTRQPDPVQPERLPQPGFPPFADDRQHGGGSRTWVIPRGMIMHRPNLNTGTDAAIDAAGFFPLAGGPFAFDRLDILQKSAGGYTVATIAAAQLTAQAAAGGSDAEAQASLIFDRLTRPRADFAGIALDRPVIMGIINTTPDSFSDGGDHADAAVAINAGQAMVAAGADILDVGGESTRPGADPVSREEECARILPAITSLAGTGYCVSADTRHTEVMDQALQAGAAMINDVGGLRDAGAAELIGRKAVPGIIMHMQGEPGTMQKDPRYDHAPSDVYDWLDAQIDRAEKAGVKRSHLAVDPGFGFGKTPQHNMEIMAHLALYHGLGVPVVLGVSRKSTIGHFSKGEPAKERMPGSLALAALGRQQGVQIFRVHDVAETAQALALAETMLTSG